MSIKIDINSDALIKHSVVLSRMRKSALPTAIRDTLNSAAFDVKGDTLFKSAQENFITRDQNFFRANSRVEKATGFDINMMKSTVGMLSMGGTNHAVDDLEQQEHGGTIKGKSFIPSISNEARSSKSKEKKVRKEFRLSQLKKLVRARSAQGSSEGQRFIKTAHHVGVRGVFLSERGIVWRVNSLTRTSRGSMKLSRLYTYKSGRSVSIKNATHFMEEAAEKSAKKIPRFFQRNALRQIRRIKK